MGSTPDQISDLQRDASGNFVYQAPDGSMVTVYADSPTAGTFEVLWSAASEIHEKEQARRAALAAEKKPRHPLDRLWDWLRNLVPARWRKGTSVPTASSSHSYPAITPAGVTRTSIPATASKDSPSPEPSLERVQEPEERTIDDGLGYEPDEDCPPKKNGAPSPVKIATTLPGPKPSPETFAISRLAKDPASGEYSVQFSDGISVRVPPDSQYAKRFDRCFAEQEKIRHSLEEADVPHAGSSGRGPAVDQDVEIASKNAALITGKLVPMGNATNGKPRFALEANGSLYPLPLTDRETKAIDELAASGHLVRIQALAEPTTQITLRTVEINDGDGVVLKPFRDLIKKDRDPSRRRTKGLDLFNQSPEKPVAAAPEAPAAVEPSTPTPVPAAAPRVPEAPSEPSIAELADAATPSSEALGEESGVHYEELAPQNANAERPNNPAAPAPAAVPSEVTETPADEDPCVVEKILIPAGDMIDGPPI